MHTISVSGDDAGQRIDRFLRKLFPRASLTLIYSCIRKRRILLNGAKPKINTVLADGDTIDIRMSEKDFADLSRETPAERPRASACLDPSSILYEDAVLLIVNKDASMTVHPGDHRTSELSLIQLVHDYLGDRVGSLTFRPSLVHRLDRDTTGVIMIAKTRAALDALSRDMREHDMEKIYIAICVGTPKSPEGTIRAPLLRLEDATHENKIQISPKGQSAVTHYRVLASGIHDRYSLVWCQLETGRMHQIRVHLASIGCPVLGDETYGDRSANSHAKREYGVVRQMLHAGRLSITHPTKKVKCTYKARPKPDMMELLTGYGDWKEWY